MKTVRDYSKFKIYLQNEFIERVKKNPSYSLRAFAKSLDINDSTLSKILKGKLNITDKRFNFLSEKLKIRFEDLNYFFPKNELSKAQYIVLNEWYCLAFLELLKTKRFINDPNWIAQKLQISINEVNLCIHSLKIAKLIKLNKKDNSIKLISANNKWNSDSEKILRQLHLQLQETFIKKSLQTLYSTKSSEKENSSLTVACSRKLMPEIKNKINKFKTELDDFIEANGKHDDVYQLNISFFPLTNKQGESL
jgi:transcriptional regulator with XRE-family HTH domain